MCEISATNTHLEVRRHKTDGLTLDRFVFTDPRELQLSTTLRF